MPAPLRGSGEFGERQPGAEAPGFTPEPLRGTFATPFGLALLLETRNLVGRKIQTNGSRLARQTCNESEAIKRKDHLVDRGRRDFEVAQEVSLRRWTTAHFRVRVDESEILALQVCEAWHSFVISSRPACASRFTGRRRWPSDRCKRGFDAQLLSNKILDKGPCALDQLSDVSDFKTVPFSVKRVITYSGIDLYPLALN